MKVLALNAAGQTVCGFESKHPDAYMAVAEGVRISRQWNKSEKRPHMVVESVTAGGLRSYLPRCNHLGFFEPHPLHSKVTA